MATAIPNPDGAATGTARKQLLPEPQDSGAKPNGRLPHLAARDFWTAPANAEAGPARAGDPASNLISTLERQADGQAMSQAIAEELEQLRSENTELRSIIAELNQKWDQTEVQGDQKVDERLKEYESLLEEKSELIRNLHLKIQEIQDQRPVKPPTPKEEELLALSEELDRERCQLQQERRQVEEDRRRLEEDELEMTKQMRSMEVQMARERADFARQRSELNRLYEEIRREMENVERNGLLNQRLGQLRERVQDVSSKHGNHGGSSRAASHSHRGKNEAESDASESSDQDGSERGQSFLGRLFG
jgi:hypothetical protein